MVKKFLDNCKKMINGIFENIKKIFQKIIGKIKSKKRWNVYLYFNNQCIKQIKVDDSFKPVENFYIVDVRGLKRFFGTNKKIKMIFIFSKYKFTDEAKKELHIEVKQYEGVD